MDDLVRTARGLLLRNELGLIDLWILYWNHGGHCHPFDLDAFICDVAPATWLNKAALQAAVCDLALDAVA